MSGECIESGQNGENGHFGEYSHSPNWRIFGEYSNSTNSPASGHCLTQYLSKIFRRFRDDIREELDEDPAQVCRSNFDVEENHRIVRVPKLG
jgi:hypothetical protein